MSGFGFTTGCPAHCRRRVIFATLFLIKMRLGNGSDSDERRSADEGTWNNGVWFGFGRVDWLG